MSRRPAKGDYIETVRQQMKLPGQTLYKLDAASANLLSVY
jgi:hypothetical protein